MICSEIEIQHSLNSVHFFTRITRRIGYLALGFGHDGFRGHLSNLYGGQANEYLSQLKRFKNF